MVRWKNMLYALVCRKVSPLTASRNVLGHDHGDSRVSNVRRPIPDLTGGRTLSDKTDYPLAFILITVLINSFTVGRTDRRMPRETTGCYFAFVRCTVLHSATLGRTDRRNISVSDNTC